jgi:hypothetical protein
MVREKASIKSGARRDFAGLLGGSAARSLLHGVAGDDCGQLLRTAGADALGTGMSRVCASGDVQRRLRVSPQ